MPVTGEGVFLADIDIIAIDWGLALLGGLQLVVAVVVMYTINPIGRKPLLLYGEKYSSAEALMIHVLQIVSRGKLRVPLEW